MRSLERVTLRELLPSSISADPDVLAAAAAIDAELRKVTESIPNVSIIPRIRELTDSQIIDLLAWQFHVDFYDPLLSLEIRGELVAKSLDWHTRKGTPSVVEEIVATIFSDGKVEEWFTYGGAPYFFKVTSNNMPATKEELEYFIAAINDTKNTRSWLEAVILELRSTGSVYAGTAYHEISVDTARITRRVPDMSPPPITALAGTAYAEITVETHTMKGVVA